MSRGREERGLIYFISRVIQLARLSVGRCGVHFLYERLRNARVIVLFDTTVTHGMHTDTLSTSQTKMYVLIEAGIYIHTYMQREIRLTYRETNTHTLIN